MTMIFDLSMLKEDLLDSQDKWALKCDSRISVAKIATPAAQSRYKITQSRAGSRKWRQASGWVPWDSKVEYWVLLWWLAKAGHGPVGDVTWLAPSGATLIFSTLDQILDTIEAWLKQWPALQLEQSKFFVYRWSSSDLKLPQSTNNKMTTRSLASSAGIRKHLCKGLIMIHIQYKICVASYSALWPLLASSGLFRPFLPDDNHVFLYPYHLFTTISYWLTVQQLAKPWSHYRDRPLPVFQPSLCSLAFPIGSTSTFDYIWSSADVATRVPTRSSNLSTSHSQLSIITLESQQKSASTFISIEKRGTSGDSDGTWPWR